MRNQQECTKSMITIVSSDKLIADTIKRKPNSVKILTQNIILSINESRKISDIDSFSFIHF